MAEAVTRTSKGTVLEGVEANASAAFDMRSPKGLTDMLQAARQSGLDPEAYAEFRNMVLEYAQGGGTDQELRKKIESISKPLIVRNIKVTEAPPQGSTAIRGASGGKTAPFSGIARPEPKFPTPAAPRPQPKVEARPKPSVPPNLPTGDTQGTHEIREIKTAPAASVAERPQSAMKEEPMPVAHPQVRPIQTVDQYKARISEIKRTVNAQVGNPIVLMDGKNGIGREYMAALLSAMKAVSGNAPGTLQSSMDRLEKAFTAVSNLGDAIPKKTEEPEKVKAETIPAEPAAFVQTPTVAREDTRGAMQPPRAAVPLIQKMRIEEEKADVKTPVVRAIPPVAEPKKAPIPAPVKVSTHEPELNEVKAAQPVSTHAPLRRSSAPIPPITAMSGTGRPVPQKVGETSPTVKEGGKHAVKGVGRSGFDATIPGDVDTPVPPAVKDDLHAPEIDAGLDQLLHEWSLFGGTGLFGTGPGGRAHPLFKKIAPLPMEMVVAGSYEGATKEATLSVRDYANGWRHEQGIAYLPSESFETYLRRVIKRILKRQG